VWGFGGHFGAPMEKIMPKMKTKRGAAKRLKRTGTGKLKRAGGWKQHKLQSKQPKRRRRLRKSKLVAKSDEARLRVLVPYL
jgi:large subunit ribosomal protein L35